MGRPTLLTPEMREAIVALIRQGNYVSTACAAVGICEDTYYEWVKRGKAGLWPYSEFTEALKTAHAEGEVHLVDIVESAAQGGPQYWQAAMTILERTRPDRWGRRVKVSGDDEQPLYLGILSQLRGKRPAELPDPITPIVFPARAFRSPSSSP